MQGLQPAPLPSRQGQKARTCGELSGLTESRPSFVWSQWMQSCWLVELSGMVRMEEATSGGKWAWIICSSHWSPRSFIRSLTTESEGESPLSAGPSKLGKFGIQGSSRIQTDWPSLIFQQMPFKRMSLPAKIQRQEKLGAWLKFAWRKEEWGKYFT